MTDEPFDLNIHTMRLLMSEPFFAALSRRIDKIKTTSLPTAGVRVNPVSAQFELFYNPDFMSSLSDEHKVGVLMHEFYHIIFEHVTSSYAILFRRTQSCNSVHFQQGFHLGCVT